MSKNVLVTSCCKIGFWCRLLRKKLPILLSKNVIQLLVLKQIQNLTKVVDYSECQINDLHSVSLFTVATRRMRYCGCGTLCLSQRTYL